MACMLALLTLILHFLLASEAQVCDRLVLLQESMHRAIFSLLTCTLCTCSALPMRTSCRVPDPFWVPPNPFLAQPAAYSVGSHHTCRALSADTPDIISRLSAL